MKMKLQLPSFSRPAQVISRIKRKLTNTVLFILTLVLLVTCKKNVDKRPTCKIVTMTDAIGSSTSIINFTYNNDGKISTVTSGVISSVFTYSGNTIIATKAYNGTFSERDSISLNSNGNVINIRRYSDKAGTIWNNQSFEYNGSGVLLKILETNNRSATPQTTVVTITNGNTVGFQIPGGSSAIEYYNDKSVQPGDYVQIIDRISYGIPIYPQKNLVKSISNSYNTGSSLINVNYEMDANGYISKITSTRDNIVETITYQYQCD